MQQDGSHAFTAGYKGLQQLGSQGRQRHSQSCRHSPRESTGPYSLAVSRTLNAVSAGSHNAGLLDLRSTVLQFFL